MTIDVERARAETPGTQYVTHLNNAGAGLAPQVVLDAVRNHIERESRAGAYEAAAAAADEIEAVHDDLAELLGARRHEVALMDSATAAWNAAFSAVRFDAGDTIVTARSEYPSNAVNLLVATQRWGTEILLIDDDEHGQVSLEALRAAVDERTRLIALTHVPTSGGLVNPAAEVGRIARDAGVLFLLDACQSVGQLRVDVGELGCDMLSTAGRKFLRGPRGTGALYVREDALDRLRPAVLDTRSSTWTGPSTYTLADGAQRFESWEFNVAARLGLGAAVRYALGWGIDDIAARAGELASSLRDQLARLPAVAVHDKGLVTCAIVTFGVDGIDAATVHTALSKAEINTSVTSAAVARYDFPERGLDTLVRASPHYYNTEAELERLVEVVAALTAA